MRCVAQIQRFVKVMHLIHNVTTTIYRFAQFILPATFQVTVEMV